MIRLTMLASLALVMMACGNGAMALYLAQQIPNAHIVGIDYSDGVLALARQAIEREGLAGRVRFEQVSGPHDGWEVPRQAVDGREVKYDGSQIVSFQPK